MVAFPEKTRKERRKTAMRQKTCEEILKEMEERIKTMVKELLEALMKEEREIYLENHPTKANGYYTRNLLTLVGPVEDLKVPRVIPRVSPA
jgi:hypothetical protein